MKEKTKAVRPPDRGLIVFKKAESIRDTKIPSVSQDNIEMIEPQTETAAENEKAPNISPCVNASATEKKIGILRRSESFSLSDALSLDISTILNQKLILPDDKPSVQKTGLSKSRTEAVQETSAHHLTTDLDKDFELKIPDSMASLKSSTLRSDVMPTKSSKSAFSNKSTTKHPSRRQIPYWLKPTPVQVYPYTFIRAVRKKLESIATTNEQTTDVNGRSHETPVARPKLFRKPNAQNFRKNLDENPEQSRSQQMLDMINSVPLLQSLSPQSSKQEEVPKPPLEEDKLHSKDPSSLSEFNTNFSSISLHISGSNTTSDFSSFQSDPRRVKQHEHLLEAKPSATATNNENGSDTESVSSAIFSHSSPEKKSINFKIPPQPLSTENIEKLQISSKSLPSIPANQNSQFVTMQRGDGIKLNEQKNAKEKSATEITDSNIRELLESFNRSLSQVIQVNQKLHHALANPPKSISNPIDWNTKFSLSLHSTANDGRNPNDNVDYSETFENATVKDEKHLYSSSFENTNDSQTDRESSTNFENQNSIKRVSEELSKNETIKSVPSNQLEMESVNDSTLDENQIESFLLTDVNKMEKSIEEIDQSKNSSATIPSEISIETIDSRNKITESIVETQSSNQKTEINQTTTEIEATLNIENHSVDHAQVECAASTSNNNELNFRRNTTNIPSSLSDEVTTAQIKDKDLNSTYGSDIYAIINQTEMEFSVLSTNDNQTIISEGSLSYSSIGMVSYLVYFKLSIYRSSGITYRTMMG